MKNICLCCQAARHDLCRFTRAITKPNSSKFPVPECECACTTESKEV